MSDLISREAVADAIQAYFLSLAAKEIRRVDVVDCHYYIQQEIEKIPVAYDVEKVVEQIKEWSFECQPFEEKQSVIARDNAIFFVKAGGKE